MRDPIPVHIRREAFYLVFLKHLVQNVPGAHFCVRDDCNLRFFFGSDRVPEVLACDTAAQDLKAFSGYLQTVVASEPLIKDLAERQMRLGQITQLSAPDDPEIAWNLTLSALEGSAKIDVKIVMCARAIEETPQLESIRESVLKGYRMSSLMLPHYSKDVEFTGKVQSLTVKSPALTKAIYDLWVLHRVGARTLPGFTLSPAQVKAARENTLSLSYHDFEKEVLPFLAPGPGTERNAKDTWNGLASVLVDILSQFGEDPGG